jgi:rSAM/selenodomain-associated transferase 1
MLLAAVALLLLEHRWPLLSAIAAALGAQMKLLPGLLAAAWARRYRPWHAAVAALVAGLLVLPYASEPAGLVRSLSSYGRRWRFNDSLFALIAPAIGARAAAVAGGLVLLLLAIVLAWRRTEPARAALIVSAAWLALAGNVLPWYALWLLPWLVVAEAPALVAFTLTVPLAYLVYPGFLAGGPWRVGWDVRALEYGIPLAVAAWVWIRRCWPRRRKSGSLELAGQDLLIVFVKRPVAGQVKTRLNAELGPEGAARLYRLLVEAVMRSTAPVRGEFARRLYVAPAGAVGEVTRWFPGETCRPQSAGDLGARLAAAFDEAFASGARRVAIIGSDAPSLDGEYVREAFETLERSDVVLGAAEDGGYTLVALKRPAPGLFRDVPWSTPEVLPATLARAGASGLVARVLKPPRRDIDTLDDLRAEWSSLRPIVARDPALLARLEPLVEGRPVP